MKKPKAKAPQSTRSTLAVFKQLKREQIASVKALMKVVPKMMLLARVQRMTDRERQRLEQKIRYCRDRIRFCYFLYTDAVALLGPKPKWLTTP